MLQIGKYSLASVSLGILALGIGYAHASFGSSHKRGLCFTPNVTTPQDDKIWIQPSHLLPWYYSYGMTPPSTFDNVSQDEFEFVPMLWGAPAHPADTTFLDTIRKLIESGRAISHVMYVYSWVHAPCPLFAALIDVALPLVATPEQVVQRA